MAKVDYDGSTITISEVRSILGSSFTGDGITAPYDPHGNTAVTRNCQPTGDSGSSLSQFALVDSNGTAGSAIDGWTESNFRITNYTEVPRLSYTTTASKWTTLQNFFIKNKLLKSRYAIVLSTFTDKGKIPKYEGNPA